MSRTTRLICIILVAVMIVGDCFAAAQGPGARAAIGNVNFKAGQFDSPNIVLDGKMNPQVEQPKAGSNGGGYFSRIYPYIGRTMARFLG